MQTTKPTKPGTFIWRILVPFIGVLVVTLVISGWTLAEIARRQNDEAEQRSLRLVQIAWDNHIDGLKKLIRDYSAWGQTYDKLHVNIDKGWAFDSDNVGPSLYANFSIEQVAVVNASYEPVYFLRGGRLTDNTTFKDIQQQLAGLIEKARALPDDGSPLTRTLTVAGLPTVFVAAPITTGSDPNVQAVAGSPSVMIFGEAMTDRSLEALGAKALVDHMRAARDAADAAETPHLQLGSDGSANLTLRWSPRRPGTALIGDLVPWLALATSMIFAIVGLIVGFARETQRTIALGARKLERAFEDAEHRALHDAATGLPNRAMLMAHLANELARSRGCLSLIYVDLDKFKLINDTLGHPVGDVVLETTAVRLRAIVAPDDLVSRVGGDEFVIVARRETVEDVEALCRALLLQVPQPIDHLDHRLRVGLSIGVARAPGDSTEAGELVRLADIALYQAKAEGRRSYRFFAPEMSARVFARAGMEHELARALRSEELQLTFEQTYDAHTMEVVQREARLSWRHPVRGVVPAADFQPIAEETDMIAPIVAWTLKAACAAAAKWDDLGLSVKVPIGRLRPGQLAALVGEALSASGLSPRRLELCVTDRGLSTGRDDAIVALENIRRMDVRLAIADDAGGCPSLDALKAFRFDAIRVGGGCIAKLGPTSLERSILRAVIGLGASFGASVTAEGVESSDQLLILQVDRCALVQGPLLSADRTAAVLDEALGYDGTVRAERLTIGQKV